MTNYDLETVELLKTQILLSSSFIFSTLLSITLTYNEILKHQHKVPLYSENMENNILKFNRIFATLIAVGFVLINIKDKKTKQNYNLCNEQIANLQIGASELTLIATLIVLYIAFNNPNNVTSIENPTL